MANLRFIERQFDDRENALQLCPRGVFWDNATGGDEIILRARDTAAQGVASIAHDRGGCFVTRCFDSENQHVAKHTTV